MTTTRRGRPGGLTRTVHPDRLSAGHPSPVYRTEIKQTGRRSWYWRVEIDVQDGCAWSGAKSSYREASREVARLLRSLSHEAIVEQLVGGIPLYPSDPKLRGDHA